MNPPANSSPKPAGHRRADDVKSIGHYTGLETLTGLNLRENDDERDERDERDETKCTCSCTCEVCTSVRKYREAKEMGIDFHLDGHLATYLNGQANYVHDLREHNVEIEHYDDLIRLLPDSKLLVAIVTFNMNGKHCSSLNDLLLPDSLEDFPDVYAVGVQEFFRDTNEVREFTIELQATIGPTHVLLHEASYGVLHLSLFVRRDLIWYVSVPEDDSLLCKFVNTPTNLIRTKGAVAISFRVFGTSFLFVNNHLPAHQSKLQERVEEYHRMSTGLDLPRNLKQSLKRSYLSHDVTNRFDCAFWFGDLNFRVDQDQETVLEEIALANIERDENNKPCFDSIFLHDQLTLEREKGEILGGFDEAPINFQPTYKYLIGCNEYDSEKRIPSYTDRILFKNKRLGHISCKMYCAIQDVKTSDHKPVFGLFQCNVRPTAVDNQAPSNAGYFNHDVYVEGLKRLNSRRLAMKSQFKPEHKNSSLIANLKAKRKEWFHTSVN